MINRKITGGCNGKILRVNLSDNITTTENIDDSFYRKYVGGSGIIAYYLLKELEAGIDPLGPENKLIFASGPLTGINFLGCSRNTVGAKSPMSGGIVFAHAGGYWCFELKRTGYDAVIIEGKADRPVYLWIHDGEPEIRDAGFIWGKNTKETQLCIRSELKDDKVRVTMIGPAGEKQVRMACIMNGTHDAAARGGLGAVMGSKNLKAIAVRGRRFPEIASPERLNELRKKWSSPEKTYPHLMLFKEFGTGGPEMEEQQAEGNLPVRNWSAGLFPVKKITAPTMMEQGLWRGKDGCYACIIRCKKKLGYEGDEFSIDPEYGGPEYESLSALGSNCGIEDVKVIIKANELCNAYGIDTISTGSVIAFAMECYEKGLLTHEDTNGMELRFGDGKTLLQCIELIARREGFGAILGDGVARLSRRIGEKSFEFAMHVKGLEAGQHEPRLKPFMGLNFMVNPSGADHNICMVIDPGNEEMMAPFHPLGLTQVLPADDLGPQKVAMFRFEQLKFMAMDCMVICAFMPFDYGMIAELMSIVTGWDTGVVEQLRVGERIITMSRLFNVREGFSSADDKLPERYFQPKTDGALSRKRLDPAMMERAKKYYYTMMGWDRDTGIPFPEKLEELGITGSTGELL